ncbi:MULTISPECIES: DUF58 domain-containing protein [unclassified Actinomyces]|uniref:DUF58 domain-containing protein n=1 Tax=unclassified Actinomyces TaxID=2609248 RepID=UPI0027BB09BA|nr:MULTISPECIES: DUF58 domain-containing protein [unclassified Actinomyces]MCL3777797.1 DUF58 domain-containing protein [Actinomyces sp. AC-20-1]MCL3790819.1 DUF58 domain-containing protein [Actinomyces sp. 187325]MCL3792695.1 DUF58 domain-containing protein [Actinomyces sp. 186855]MCL3795560.1 DUF58 domain-containing protein [Actinomyces sp. 217892]
MVSSPVSRLARVRGRLELPTLRRATGLLDGRHKSVLIGRGQDLDDLSLYRPGDDVGDIDWKASARTGQPVIKRFQRESSLPLVLAVDTGRTMAAQAPDGTDKREIAQAVADTLAYLARQRGDTLALVAADAARMVDRPARSGSEHAEMLLALLDRQLGALTTSPAGGSAPGAVLAPGAEETVLAPGAPASRVSAVLERVSTWHRRRSLVVLITDTAHPDAQSDPEAALWLRRLSAQHELVVVQVADAAPLGPGRRRDVELAAEVPAFLRQDTRLTAQLGAEDGARRARVATLLDSRRIEHVTVTSLERMVDELADLLARQRLASSRRRR